MMCPHADNPPAELGRHVSIAWNGSLEAVRAVVMMRRIIEAADRVTILSSGTESPGTTAEDYREYLDLRGISATIERFPAGRRAGAALLTATASVGADLMIMGAYGDSHERETIFGGNTQVVVDDATLPVVLVH
jgi:nucleotide-binding universal stress UspA family protein